MTRLREKKVHRKKKLWQKLLIIIGAVIGSLAALFILLLAFLTITEYRPKASETLTVEMTGEGEKKNLAVGDSLELVTWNTGFAALGDNADFFMDGGSMVYTADKARVKKNLKDMEDRLSELKPDIIFLQEIDKKSSRSYRINEVKDMLEKLSSAYAGTQLDSAFAYNFKVAYVPYPIPPIGHVESGILTITSLDIVDAERINLPCPFSWPVRMANLKRGLLVTRIPVAGSGDRELVLINLHMEAYDDGEGKIEQTKMLADIMDQEIQKGNYVIAGGDFNQTFSSIDTSMYPEYEGNWMCGRIDVEDFSEGWQFAMDNTTPTCRSLDRPLAGADLSNFQFYMIDGYIVSENVRIDEVKTMDYGFIVSDHNPVYLKVTFQ